MSYIFKNGDEYIEIDEVLSSDKKDTLEKIEDKDLEDTIEMSDVDSEDFSDEG